MMKTKSVEEISISDLKKFIETHYLKNRTIVSRDISSIIDDVEALTGLPVLRHRYQSGEDHGTWIIPPQWDVKEAWLKDEKGEVIASYDEHPLFVAPYSKSIRTTVTKEDLLKHTMTSEKQPDAFFYNWRYALHAKLRLNDWGLSLPKQRLEKLSDGPFELCIDADVVPGEMLVGEIIIPGETEDALLFVADYCHPGQANDSFSGLAMFMKVMREIAQMPRRRYTYRFLIVPETIGSAVYVASGPDKIKHVFGSVFSDTVAWGEKWYLKETRTGKSYMDILAADCRRTFGDIETSTFWSLSGNDEYILDSAQVGIPSLSLMKYPFAEYHTSNDTPSRIVDADMERAGAIIMHMVSVLERDVVFESAHPVPFWMSRYDLFADAIFERKDYLRNFDIVYRLLDGKHSIAQIANILDYPFDEIYGYMQKMQENGLVRTTDRKPWTL